MANPYTGSVRLISRKTRVVEVLGPELPGSKRPTDVELRWETYENAPRTVGFCFKAEPRRARFYVTPGTFGDSLLDFLEPRRGQSQLAKPYGLKGWLIEEHPRLGTASQSTKPPSRRSDGGNGRRKLYHSAAVGRVLSVR